MATNYLIDEIRVIRCKYPGKSARLQFILDSGEMLFFAPGGCSRRVCDPPIAGRRSQTGFEQ